MKLSYTYYTVVCCYTNISASEMWCYVHPFSKNIVRCLRIRIPKRITVCVLKTQSGESHALNDRVHGISCRYSDKTCKKINYISTNTYSIIMQENAHTSSLFKATIHLSIFLQCIVVFRRSPSKIEILKTILVRTCVENYCILWSNFEINVCFE